MTTTRSSTSSLRALLRVPSPETTVSVGQFYENEAYSGVGVWTSEHIRFYSGGPKDESDFIAQATGQVWLQALQNVDVQASRSLVVSSTDSTFIVASKQIDILSGYSVPGPSSEGTPGETLSAVTAYADKRDTRGQSWIVFNSLMLIPCVILGVMQRLITPAFGWVGALGLSANIAGSVLNVLSLTRTNPIPGINAFSKDGVLISSTLGSVNVAAGAGLLMSSPFLTQLSLTNAIFRGAARVGISAVGPVDLTSLSWTDAKCEGPLNIAARLGTVDIVGVNMQLGLTTTRIPQAPTTHFAVEALREITHSAKTNVKLNAMGKVTSEALTDHTINATLGPALLKCLPHGMKKYEGWVVSLHSYQSGFKLAGYMSASVQGYAGPNPLNIFAVPNGNGAVLGPTTIELKAAGGGLKITPKLTAEYTGVEMKIT